MKYFFALFVSLLLFSCSNNNEGDKIKHFTATTLAGNAIDTKTLGGKTIVIKIWATWCGECIAEIPELNELTKEYKENPNVVFLAITDDNQQKIQIFLERIPFDYQQITDRKDIKTLYQPAPIKEIPKHLIINKNGDIVLDVSGGIPQIAKVLDAKIKEQLDL